MFDNDIFNQQPNQPQGNNQQPNQQHQHKGNNQQRSNQQPANGLPLFRTALDGVGERANEAIIKLSLFFSTGFGAFGVGYIFDSLIDTNLPNLDNALQNILSYMVGFGLCYIADFKGINGILPVAVSQFSALTTGKFAFNVLTVVRATLFALIAVVCLIFSIVASGAGFSIASKNIVMVSNSNGINTDSLAKAYNKAVAIATNPIDRQIEELQKTFEADAVALLGKTLYDSYARGNGWAQNKAKELGIEPIREKHKKRVELLQKERADVVSQQKELHGKNVEFAKKNADIRADNLDEDINTKNWYDILIGYAPTILGILAVCVRAISVVYVQVCRLDGHKINDTPYNF